MKIGILALQGDFSLHAEMFEKLHRSVFEVKNPEELSQVDALVIPGGESTVMLKVIKEGRWEAPIQKFAKKHPIWGTCAGAILLARSVKNPVQDSLGLIDIDITRNAYGRQVDSFITRASFLKEKTVEIVCIRAPKVTRVGKNVKVLIKRQSDPVLLREGKILVSTFHPELGEETKIHEYFLSMLK